MIHQPYSIQLMGRFLFCFQLLIKGLAYNLFPLPVFFTFHPINSLYFNSLIEKKLSADVNILPCLYFVFPPSFPFMFNLHSFEQAYFPLNVSIWHWHFKQMMCKHFLTPCEIHPRRLSCTPTIDNELSIIVSVERVRPGAHVYAANNLWDVSA